MRRVPVPAFMLPVLLFLTCAGAIRGENGPLIEPAAGILWNDRVDDVRRKLAVLPEIDRLEIALLFNDTVTNGAFGPRAIVPGNGNELAEAVGALAREYLAGVDADRAKGGGSLAGAFDLHCAGIFADKSGTRKAYLDAVLRMSARPFRFEGAPFVLTAEFRVHPGAGLTGRYALPIPGTKYVLPLVLTKVTLSPASQAAARAFPGIAEAQGKNFARSRRCAVGPSEGWCDDRGVSVSIATDPAAIRYDAETFWIRGLDAMYKEHIMTLNGGKSCRCHAMPARGGVY